MARAVSSFDSERDAARCIGNSHSFRTGQLREWRRAADDKARWGEKFCEHVTASRNVGDYCSPVGSSVAAVARAGDVLTLLPASDVLSHIEARSSEDVASSVTLDDDDGIAGHFN